MRIVAFIPLRSGSKSIPHKNVKLLNEKPLAQWTIDAANSSKYITDVFISIDSTIISEKLSGAKIFWRSESTATDSASSELALIEFCESRSENDLIVFLQATSPMISADEIDRGIEAILVEKFDSAVSVVTQKRFLWKNDGIPLYDLENRPRRQDWEGHLVENGGFYISYTRDILHSKCRLSGRIGIVECSESTYYEIDEEIDWIIVENLMKRQK